MTERDCIHCGAWPSSLGLARSAVVLDFPADRLVHGLKYQGWRRLADLMGDRMAATFRPRAAEAHVVIPVPTTRRRIRARGYNQAALIAAAYARRTGLPYRDPVLRREGESTQVTLTPEQRRENVRDAFAIERGRASDVEGRHVVVIDDVLTTGATAAAVASALERAGAAGVTLLTFARSLPDWEGPRTS